MEEQGKTCFFKKDERFFFVLKFSKVNEACDSLRTVQNAQELVPILLVVVFV